MTTVAEGTRRWSVSAQASGEVLTTSAAVPGVQLMLIGHPDGHEADEITGWLDGLARAASERASTSEAPAGDPVPTSIREALSGLLFSHGELWNKGRKSCSVALVADDRRIAFGWVGDASVEAYQDGARAESEWVSIRDAHGREARAWCGAPAHDVRVTLRWSPGSGAETFLLEARWYAIPLEARPRSEDVALETTGAIEAIEVASVADALDVADAPGAEESAARGAFAPSGPDLDPQSPLGEGEQPSSGVARWLARHVSWAADQRSIAAQPKHDSPPPAESRPEVVAESLEAHAAPDTSESPGSPPAHSRVEEPPIPTPFEGDEATEMPALLPDLIPPSPEPAALTAVTVGEREGAGARPPRSPAWPAAVASRPPRAPLPWKRFALWGGVIAVLFGGGWLLGSFQGAEGPPEARRPSPLVLFLRKIGLAPPRFGLAVTSQPEGALIAVDGKELTLRTPATVELAPGEHRLDLSFPELGSVAYTVTGAKDEQLTLDAPMWGAVDVVASDTRAVLSVALDGRTVGFVPMKIDSVAPGPHVLRFSGPGMASWGSTIDVRVGETREVLAFPLQSPATGLLQVRANLTAEGESQALNGARVWVDGTLRGVTPLTLELPRGPHSVRAAHGREESAVQLIELPGGNQRFATFDFGLGSQSPTIALKAPETFSDDEPSLISATIAELAAGDVKEMWLHVRSPDGRWRRLAMTLMDAQGSVVGVAPFPASSLGQEGRTSYYVSALSRHGDEHFTEIYSARRSR